MTRRLPLLALAFALTLAACGPADSDTATAPEPDTATAEDAPAVQMIDGVQVAEIEVSRMGYDPINVELQAGIPARLVFTRTIESACAEQIQAPDFAVAVTDLPLNESVAIEFTPDEAGSFTYMCGMDMMRGTVIVQA
ncbi:MAG: cupredoxin domain-containing protein [Bacteroidota bacterium]